MLYVLLKPICFCSSDLGSSWKGRESLKICLAVMPVVEKRLRAKTPEPKAACQKGDKQDKKDKKEKKEKKDRKEQAAALEVEASKKTWWDHGRSRAAGQEDKGGQACHEGAAWQDA